MSSEIKSDSISSTKALVATATGVGFLYMIFRNKSYFLKKMKISCNLNNPLLNQQIQIIESPEECKQIVNRLLSHCSENKVLGFDCEWVTESGSRHPVALLQLASYEGLCALIRLCHLKNIPNDLRELLENKEILKVGVASYDDAARLSHDYRIGVSNTFDLRFLALRANHKPEGLAKLSKNILDIELDKNWRIRCSDWEAKKLTDKQINYAAKDAFVAVEIFKKLTEEIRPKRFWESDKIVWDDILKVCQPFVDRRFKDSMVNSFDNIRNSPQTVNKKPGLIKKPNNRTLCTRTKLLYDNCFLQAPDSELLCTCDKRKAQWYLDQNLAHLITEEPFTIRLNFEPAGRAIGDVGKYYTLPKTNQCVVCGRQDAYIRKNVIPREYRKHFPVVMKSHTSHDVLLLCPQCHQISNMSDLKIREELSKMCNAPLTHEEGGAKFVEVPRLRQLRSAARALLRSGNQIPETRKKALENVILQNYENYTEITPEILEEAANADVLEHVDNYCSHGLKVVDEFKNNLGGLIELEKLWRKHFLNTMQPKFLPELWSITHNENSAFLSYKKSRLELRAIEGRIDKEDITMAGIVYQTKQKDVEKSEDDAVMCN